METADPFMAFCEQADRFRLQHGSQGELFFSYIEVNFIATVPCSDANRFATRASNGFVRDEEKLIAKRRFQAQREAEKAAIYEQLSKTD